jgi:hypothetical protein
MPLPLTLLVSEAVDAPTEAVERFPTMSGETSLDESISR